ncbi:MAG: LD-carboxypeptidase [Lachnospiraceae bacterium]
MRFPKYIQQGDTIGVTAPSGGILEKIDSYESSINQLKNRGFKLYETKNVRTKGIVSSGAIERAQQLHELYEKEEVSAIITATGGEFLMEMLPFVDYNRIGKHPKWIQGYSDPTGLLYTITTKCQIATIYGPNACSYDMSVLHESLENNLNLLQGKDVIQRSFSRYQSGWGENSDGYDLDNSVFWDTPNGAVDVEGRLIGGCLDCLQNLVGTKYDATKQFVEAYQTHGFIWYFDIFSLKAEDVVRSLWQMKEAGWFQFVKAFIVGRVRFPESFVDFTYTQAFRQLFPDIPLIMNADIGHVKPQMTIINGAMGRVRGKDGTGSIQMWEG